jgi:truncated hemoglobin YjbI
MRKNANRKKKVVKEVKVRIPPCCPISPATQVPFMFEHPLQKIKNRACLMSGISLERANAIDDLSLGITLGEYHINLLVERFYDKVLADKDEWFTCLFTSEKEKMIENEYEFLLQRFGGPCYYSDNKSYPALCKRHSNFEMSPRMAEKWLGHMENVLEEMIEDIPDETRYIMMDYFKHTCYLLIASQEAQILMVTNQVNDTLVKEEEIAVEYKMGMHNKLEDDISNLAIDDNVDVDNEIN